MASTNGNAKNETRVFDRAYRINELAKIEQNIVTLMHSAGKAIQALGFLPGQDNIGSTLDARKEAFQTATAGYFRALSYVDVNMRRQIYALEEANIIPAELSKEAATDEKDSTSTTEKRNATTSGSMGNLDVGWLNSRNDRVGIEMRSELWEELRDLLVKTNVKDIFSQTSSSRTENPNGELAVNDETEPSADHLANAQGES